MDTQSTSPRTEPDLTNEPELARHLKVCRRQLHSWRIAGSLLQTGQAVRFRVADVVAAIERMEVR